ncbi:MAG: hypothetical protein ACTFAL_09280 [Candidatus Electronema sp. V4]|uniref:hypothetical protein n=1 Tax=Candidatus Electronema sp. V4 TaxID=3454756 RepID=UPI0040554B07
MPSLRSSSLLLPGGLFFLILLYFVFGSGWQAPATLTLRGQAVGSGPILTVRWDSGAGFNSYEQRVFHLNTSQQEDGLISVVIGATGRRYPASQSKDVVCEAVLADGKAVDFSTIAAKPVLADGRLRFSKGQQISFRLRTESSVSFRFRTDTASGIAFTEINGERTEHDLYMANIEAKVYQADYWLLRPDGSFTVETELPRYPVRELEILNGRPSRLMGLTAAELRGRNRAADLLQGQPQPLGQVRFRNVLDGMKLHFHPLQFVQQLVFALISTWLLTALLRLAGELGGLRGCFLDGRQWFWLMLAASLTVFGLWLAAFWPGVISVDSMKIWRAALLPDVYLNDHPFLNVILYKYLRHIWSNPAVVPLAQVFLSGLLTAWFGFWIFRQGAPLPLVLLWLLFVLSSVPVGVYNVVLWKDIPFALLTVFWACILAHMRREKQQGRLRWTKERVCALLLLGLALALIRHNGLVYLAALPALILLLGLVPLKKALLGLAALLLAVGIGLAGLHLAGKTGGSGFLSQELRKYSRRLSPHDLANDAQRLRRQYMTVLNINQTGQQWDKFHHYFQDRQAWWFLLHAGWWDVHPYQEASPPFPNLHKAALRVYEKSYQPPQVWLSWNPVWLLAVLPLLPLLFYWLPNSAVLSAVLLAGALPLVYLRIFNWRYYYFLYLGLLYLPAFVLLDLFSRKKCASRS